MADSQQMVLEADLSEVSLPHVLQTLGRRSATGILTVQGEEDIVAVSYLEGAVVAADALNQTVEDGLGEVLAKQGMVSTSDFSAAAAEHQGGSAGSLGTLLVEKGLVSRDQLLNALRTQTYGLLAKILVWRQGELKFYGGDEVSYEEGVQPLTVDELLVRAVEDLGERSGIASDVPPLDAVYRYRPPAEPPRIYGRDGDGDEPGMWITELEEKILQQLDGEVRAEILQHALNAGKYPMQLALLRLQGHGLLERVATKSTETGSRAIVTQGTGPQDTLAEDLSSASVPMPPRQELESLNPWVGPGLAVFLAAALALVALSRPASLLLPFPWQEVERATAERQLRQSQFLKLDHAARTFFLLRARFPDTLQELTDEGFLSELDLRDPASYGLSYTSAALSYEIDVQARGESIEGLGTRSSIHGELLLDPEFGKVDPASETPLFLIE